MKKTNLMTLAIALPTTLLALTLTACGGGSEDAPPPAATPPASTTPIAPLAGTEEELGRKLFFDANLSVPAGQSCANCHDPDTGFADPAVSQNAPVSEGAVAGEFGNRNAPTAAYAAFIPARTLETPNGVTPFYQGGLFLDGRRDTLAEQAGDPFLNPAEMANPDKAAVVNAVKASDYAGIMVYLNDENVFDNVDAAYAKITEAIAAFEKTSEVNPFTSKYDYYLASQYIMTAEEANGLTLFQGNALCSTCHTLDPLSVNSDNLFTDFRYWNIGTPTNPNNPARAIDLGLGAVINNDAAQDGRFRTPTLRNVELTAPYMHNGVFATLEDVVNFYVTRDNGRWTPEVSDNMETTNIGIDIDFLENQDEADLVAFLKTLTDGYTP
ncbi:Cytochrome c551 peroxidase [hydrothermal vent metagenome]|uniref:Cytochrome c551 peroxidase n=1 Tax=hydrothermal vent metagenome TaxID=652676 RepID=A0A3B1BFM1_9ZZZZ